MLKWASIYTFTIRVATSSKSFLSIALHMGDLMKLHTVLYRSAFSFCLAGSLGASVTAFAHQLDKAPPSFGYRESQVVAVDIASVEIEYTFDVSSSRATAHAVVTFDADETGYPLIDLVPSPTSVMLNDLALTTSDYPVISAPTGVTSVRVLRSIVDAGTRNVLEVDYALGSNAVTFTSGKVRAGFFMSDLSNRQYFEQYGPANYEFDQVDYKFKVKVVGTQTAHEIFTNGLLTEDAAGEWSIDFPDYFTTSSIYFHLTEAGRYNVQRYVYDGVGAQIPVTVYSTSSSSTRNAVSSSQRIMTELEGTYGAFAHERLVIYITPSGGGMEYGGATMTSSGALGHELTHSWFARGVMPTNANSGWIDEAIASWRDNGYPRASSAPNRSPVNLGGFSPYRRHTTQAAYSSGAKLISEFDRMFASQGGMKAVLRTLFTESQRQTITVQYFKNFLETTTGQDLNSIFNRYVYGLSSLDGVTTQTPELVTLAATNDAGLASNHPRPFTQSELKLFR
jgi:hypothetical protein